MLKDVAGSKSLFTVSPDSVTSVTCSHCEPTFICEEHRAPVTNLPILVFYGKCQASCTVLGCEHNPYLWTSGTQTNLMESVSNVSGFNLPKHGNQGKHRVTKRGPALSLFTLVTSEDIAGSVASETLSNPRSLKVCILPSCVFDKTLQEIFSGKSLCSIFFKDAVKENGGIICVERTVLSLQKPPLSCTSGISDLTGPVRLDDLDSSTEANTLCTVKGIVNGVNDRESYTWPVCNLCGSNELRPLTPKRCQFYCCQCSSDVSSPVIRMQLEVFLQCQGRPQCKVRLKLREETISSILGSCSSEDGRYEVTAVLGKELGPVHCYVQCAASMVILEEISLLQAGSAGDQ
ncbi:unnamed protein product [Ranitomeya imitator]|uniref:DUF4503 domain-containing protein n=1 Tax=Ranitomeya imitator TaxID=111125 RepID=A0ABN9LVE3_9NEOB|nr:unnamed protein product [Ranitomeya imitator]